MRRIVGALVALLVSLFIGLAAAPASASDGCGEPHELDGGIEFLGP